MSCPSGTWPRVSRIMMSFKGAPMVSMEHWFNSSSNFWRQALGALPGPTRGWPVHTAWYDAIMFWSVWPTMNCSCFVHSLASDCKPPDAQPTMTCCVGLLKYDTDLNFNSFINRKKRQRLITLYCLWILGIIWWKHLKHLLAGAVSKLWKCHPSSFGLVGQQFEVVVMIDFLLSHTGFEIVVEPFQTRWHFSCRKNYIHQLWK